MPRSTDPNFIKWDKSKAKGIILRDLEPGGALVGMEHVPMATIFQYYKQFPEFEKVCFRQFNARLKDHFKQVDRDRALAKRDEAVMLHDCGRKPQATHNRRGELVFDLHKAKKLLRKDVKNGVHLTMTPTQLRLTRPEYQQFKKKIFKGRVYQEVRRQKFLHYLDLKRKKERPEPTGKHNKVLFTASHLARQPPFG